MPKFVWTNGYHAKIDASVFGKRYTYLQKKYGDVTAEMVVQDATHALSPIHQAFEWNDQQAAHLHRLHQARTMMTSIRVLDKASDSLGPVRFLVSLTQTDQPTTSRVYVPLRDAMKDPKQREIVLRQAYRELQSFQARYRELEEFSDLMVAIETQMKSLATQKIEEDYHAE
jgi:hypothetical protein